MQTIPTEDFLTAEADAVADLSKSWKVRASQAWALMTDGPNFFSEANARDLAELQKKYDTPNLTENQEAELRRLIEKGPSATEKQLAKVQYLKAKKSGPKLTTNQMETFEKLKAKKAAPFELSQTAKGIVDDAFLREVYGYDDPVNTNEMLKGILCEQDSLGLVSKLVPSNTFRSKNVQQYSDKFKKGTPDVQPLHEGVVEDVKTSWDIRTFFAVKAYPATYYAQGQVYMDLTGVDRFRLHYCLVATPEEIIQELEKKFFFRFGCDDENKHYLEACGKIRRNHTVDHIPAELRLKTFEFERNDSFIKELHYRVKHAREYLSGLSLNKI